MTFPISNLKFKQNIDGFGEKGISIGSFEFDIYDEYELYSTAILDRCTAQLFEENNKCLPSKIYYIAKRHVNNNICSFIAYDIMSLTEKEFDHSALNVFFDRGETAPCGNVLDEIKLQCGFSIVSASSDGLDNIKFTSEQVKNKKCADILEMISKAMCGVWISDRDNNAVLSCLGEEYNTSLFPFVNCSEYSEIINQGKQKITKLICINSETDNKISYGTNEYGTVIETESPFLAAGTPLDAIVERRSIDHIYSAWSCKKAAVNEILYAVTNINFEKYGNLPVNKAVVTVDNTGIYFSGGTEPRSDEEWKYYEYLQRELDEKIRYNKIACNICVSKDTGIQFVNKNKTSSIALENESEIEKYGFNVDAGGVTEYDGAIVSNTVFETAEKLDDKTVQINYANGISYKYTLEKDENGKIKLKKERIKEEES